MVRNYDTKEISNQQMRYRLPRPVQRMQDKSNPEQRHNAFNGRIPLSYPILADRKRPKKRTRSESNTKRVQMLSIASRTARMARQRNTSASFIFRLLLSAATAIHVGLICEVNHVLKEINEMQPTLRFIKPQQTMVSAQVLSFSDAAFHGSSSQEYGQTGLICRIEYKLIQGPSIYHMTTWNSSKQKRICHSSHGAEILTCTEADDCGFYVRTSM